MLYLYNVRFLNRKEVVDIISEMITSLAGLWKVGSIQKVEMLKRAPHSPESTHVKLLENTAMLKRII